MVKIRDMVHQDSAVERFSLLQSAAKPPVVEGALKLWDELCHLGSSFGEHVGLHAATITPMYHILKTFLEGHGPLLARLYRIQFNSFTLKKFHKPWSLLSDTTN